MASISPPQRRNGFFSPPLMGILRYVLLLLTHTLKQDQHGKIWEYSARVCGPFSLDWLVNLLCSKIDFFSLVPIRENVKLLSSVYAKPHTKTLRVESEGKAIFSGCETLAKHYFTLISLISISKKRVQTNYVTKFE